MRKSKHQVNVTKLAEEAGYTPQGVAKMLNKGFTPDDVREKGKGPKKKKPTKKMDAPAIILPELDYGENSVPYAEAQRRKELYLAKLRELEFKTKSGELVSLEDVNQQVSTMILKAKQVLLDIGVRLQDRLAQETDPAQCRVMVEDECRRALRELATYTA